MPGAPLPDAAELLRSLTRAFAARGLRWYVFGAQAVVAYGRPRLTADVDVAVDLAGAVSTDLASWLEPHDFDLRFPLEPSARLLPLVHRPTAMPLDLVVTAPGLDEEFLERALLLDLGGVEVPVISPEDLIAMKVLAGRRKDLEDVRGILLEQRSLDLDRTRDVIRAFELATGARLLDRLGRLVRAANSAKSRRAR